MEYKLVRQKRKTLTVSVADGAVTVKAPKSTPVDYIERFIEQKTGWINKKLAEQARRAEFLGGVIDHTKALYYGKALDIRASEQYKRVTVTDGVMFVPQKYAEKNDTVGAIGRWYKREAAKALFDRLNALSQATGLEFCDFALTNARTKWGSCDAQCNIRLNWRLVMLEPALIDYVVIHELAHTRHHDHSSEFWKIVGELYPNYKAARKTLKTYAALTSLYR